ncbi:MAG: transglutaminase domain-containing protein [Erysipelotrichaceae bacterium]|nr:transglutaminase domain-containing protein [Erysipelotrichaceae bacterium]
MKKDLKLHTALLCALLVLLCACGEGETPVSSAIVTSSPVPVGTYEAPPFAGSSFDPDAAEGNEQVLIDLSHIEEGYLGVSATSDSRLKFQVLKDEEKYNYDMENDGTPSIFPLQSGDGTYVFRVMENIVDKKYAAIYETSAQVVLSDEFQPYLRPSDYSNYSEDSACVAKAAELAAAANSQVDVIESIYAFVTKNVTYDREKAETVQSGYLPVPDETLSTGKGICFDYASLAAAMLRSQGIPTKIVFGYVSPRDVYHAWNMFYTEETGWTVVKFTAEDDSWIRLDLTFAANGRDAKFIGDGGNYAEVYHY